MELTQLLWCKLFFFFNLLEWAVSSRLLQDSPLCSLDLWTLEDIGSVYANALGHPSGPFIGGGLKTVEIYSVSPVLPKPKVKKAHISQEVFLSLQLHPSTCLCVLRCTLDLCLF